MISPQRFAVVAVLALSATYASDRIAWFGAKAANENNTGAAAEANATAIQVVDRIAPSLAANVASAGTPVSAAPSAISSVPPAIAHPVDEPVIASLDEERAAELAPEVTIAPKVQDSLPPTEQRIVVAALTDPSEILPQTDPNATGVPPPDPAPAPNRLEIVGECLVVEPCIDQYLFAMYERTPKEDTIKEVEKRKVTIKRKGKLVTVTRSFTRLVDNDFTWKDPKAAERVGMSMIDYVIGGMDKRFKWRLFYMLQAAENAGLQPGITSAFRDDYRQSIASGLKAASNRSYHGGSTRGGYGRGLAADIVSVNGKNRAQRWVSTEALWKWIDANGKQYGIGRPYLGRDPPHVGPIDGPEYVSRRGDTRTANAKKSGKQAAKERPAIKRPVAARSAKGRNT